MNKYEIISIPENIDMTNPYKLNTLSLAGITNTTYLPGMTLNAGQWTWDTDDKAYWIYPISTSSTLGYIKLIDSSIIIQPGDEITAEFEIKCLGSIPAAQRIGVRTDLLTSTLTLINSIDFFPQEYKDEYQLVKLKRIVNPIYATVEHMNIVFGVLTSNLLSGYSVKIRNIKINIKRTTAQLAKNPITYSTYGLGLPNFSISNLTDNINTNATTGARDITLKSGMYGFIGGGTANESLNGGGVLTVLPYRSDGVGGSNYIEQIVLINSVDADAGLWRRSYNGVTSTWSKYTRVNRYVSVPVSATANGQVGDMASDANYFYVCTSMNSWRRVAIATW